MCGIVGLITSNPEALPVPLNLKLALSEIQHRGYDGAGIVLDSKFDLGSFSGSLKSKKNTGSFKSKKNTGSFKSKKNTSFKSIKNTGLIDQALSDTLLAELNNTPWEMGLAHTRYRTSGNLDLESVQPLISESGNFALVHNGQLNQTECRPDSLQILQIWEKHFAKHTNTNDNTIPKPLDNLTESELADTITSVLKDIFSNVRGSYSCLILIKHHGLVAFRDHNGIRPLIMARHPKLGIMLASETVAFNHLPDLVNWEIFDIDPGTGIFFQPNLQSIEFQIEYSGPNSVPWSSGPAKYPPTPVLLPCLFEYIYLAHPDSVLNGLSVRFARQLMGQSLARQIQQEYPDLKIDLIVPVPDSSCIATQSLARSLKLPYHELLSLNRDKSHTRSFILPTQSQREEAVRQKFILKPWPEIALTNFKNLLLVDDSIVRGTTMTHLIIALRSEYPDLENIYVASIAPVIRKANYFGIDIPEAHKLMAYQRTVPEIATILGADLLIYQDLMALEKTLLINLDADNLIRGFETSMFD